MTLPVWPAQLPDALLEGYQYQTEQPFVRTEMEVGAARQRQVSTSPLRVAQVSWRMTESQLAIYEAWVKYRIAGGAGWFTVTLRNGMGRAVVDTRMTEAPSIARDGLAYKVSAKLEARTWPVMTEAALAAMGI